MKRWLFIALIVGAGAWAFWPEPVRTHPPGILVAIAPAQTPVKEGQSWQKNGYTIVPLAEFSLTSRVLSKKRYRLGRECDLSPVDLAMGWGPMSDQAVLDQLTISQGGRWFRWRARELPIPQSEIERHAANMHMIPSTDAVRAKLLALHRGDLVRLDGYLVRAEAADGWRWQSSLSRTDTGGGSCEVVWVNDVTGK